MHTRQGVAKDPHDETNRNQPEIFEWYENKLEQSLAELYRNDLAERQSIVQIIREMHDSEMYWRLCAKYEDAREAAARVDSYEEAKVLEALLARMYIAGSLRGNRVFEPLK